MTKINASRTGTPAIRVLVVALAALSAGCADQAPIAGPDVRDPSLLTSTTIVSSTSTTSSITTVSTTSSTTTTSSTSVATSTSGGSGRMSFTVGPYSTVSMRLGDHRIYFPAGSICDPALSSYGPTEWDKPCQPLRRYITISAAWWMDASGHPRIEFQPALRFVPTSDASKWVTLTLKDQYASSAQPGQSLVITWRDESGNWIDESLTDASLVTTADPASGSVSRRIKHFSGYMVVARTQSSEAMQ